MKDARLKDLLLERGTRSFPWRVGAGGAAASELPPRGTGGKPGLQLSPLGGFPGRAEAVCRGGGEGDGPEAFACVIVDRVVSYFFFFFPPYSSVEVFSFNV